MFRNGSAPGAIEVDAMNIRDGEIRAMRALTRAFDSQSQQQTSFHQTENHKAVNMVATIRKYKAAAVNAEPGWLNLLLPLLLRMLCSLGKQVMEVRSQGPIAAGAEILAIAYKIPESFLSFVYLTQMVCTSYLFSCLIF